MSVENKIDELRSINGLKNNDRYFKVGDVIQVPTPLERVYGLLRM